MSVSWNTAVCFWRAMDKKKQQTFTKDQRCVQSIMLFSQWYQETRKSGVSWMCFNISLILSLAINETSYDSAVRARLCVSVHVCCSDDISVPERLRYCHVVSEQLRRECSSRLQALLLSRQTEQGVKRWLTFFFANSKEVFFNRQYQCSSVSFICSKALFWIVSTKKKQHKKTTTKRQILLLSRDKPGPCLHNWRIIVELDVPKTFIEKKYTLEKVLVWVHKLEEHHVLVQSKQCVQTLQIKLNSIRAIWSLSHLTGTSVCLKKKIFTLFFSEGS